MRGRSGRIGLFVVALVFVALPASAWADTPWSVGAAKVDITPTLFNTAQDLADFPELDFVRGVSCPRAVFSGPRVWRFEEPYVDTDNSGLFNYLSGPPGSAPVSEPFCDYNHNGRWEGIYLSGGADHRAVPSPSPIPGYSGPAHDPIDARAVAFSDGTKTTVLVSVVSQGMFENYLREARAAAQDLAGQPAHASCGQIDEMVVSANHNESSPDTVGIYGAPPDPTGTFGLFSGIDEYYMDWVDEQIASAAVEACDNREPASLGVVEFPVPADLELEIPNRFPTADDHGNLAAVDQKVRVLQARDASDDPIFTMMNLGAHNQELGHADTFEESHTLSSDWPGYFHRRLEQQIGGMAIFLAGDNGSQEDLITEPRVTDPACSGGAGCYPQVEATGERIADHVAAQTANAREISFGAVNGRRTEFCAPVENNLFKAAFAGGLFGERQAYTSTCVPVGEAGTDAKTSVAVLDIGPDLQVLANPGEAFPSLVVGGPWGIEDASCPTAPNPPVPAWHASAKHRFHAGLADDLIGYEKQAWSFQYGTQTFLPQYGCSGDSKHTHHVLEDEALGPTASNLVAEELTALLDANPDPVAEIRFGRYVKADGSLTDAYVGPTYSGAPGHWPTDAVAIWLAAPGTTTLNATPGQPDSGTIVALDGVGSFGSRAVNANGAFMDFDGAPEPDGPAISTRGMFVRNLEGDVLKRYYVDVYPALTVVGTLDPSLPPPGYARPKSATPTEIRLVPAYDECSSSNATHGAPLASPSCSPPVLSSDHLTVGTPDANGRPAAAAGRLGMRVVGETPIDPDNGDQSDIQIAVSFTDVRKQSDLSDYTGELRAVLGLRITDRYNSGPLTGPATAVATPFAVNLSCAATGGSEGGSCNVVTTADAVLTDVVKEGQRAIWELPQIHVFDGGGDGDADTTADNTLFAVPGLFTP